MARRISIFGSLKQYPNCACKRRTATLAVRCSFTTLSVLQTRHKVFLAVKVPPAKPVHVSIGRTHAGSLSVNASRRAQIEAQSDGITMTVYSQDTRIHYLSLAFVVCENTIDVDLGVEDSLLTQNTQLLSCSNTTIFTMFFVSVTSFASHSFSPSIQPTSSSENVFGKPARAESQNSG